MTTIYGISNCDTIRKARRWLSARGIEYTFYDVRKQGLDVEKLKAWVAEAGWETLLNRRGTTWRGLSDELKRELDEAQAIRLMQDYPALIKRPVLEHDGQLLVGFSEARYADVFHQAV